MNFWIVENGELVRYAREGECNCCAECCCTHTIAYSLDIEPHNDRERPHKPEADHWTEGDWLAWEGWSTFWWYGFWIWAHCETREEMVEKPCPSLEGNKCLHWGLDSLPGLCRVWPTHPDDIAKFPRCGFRFVRLPNEP